MTLTLAAAWLLGDLALAGPMQDTAPAEAVQAEGAQPSPQPADVSQPVDLTQATDVARPSAPQAGSARQGAPGRSALDRVAELERRLTTLESQQQPPGLPSRSGRGGVRVETDETVQDAVGLWGPVLVAGTVRGTAVGLGSDVLVQDGGRVEGDAVSLGGKVTVAPGGDLSGQAVELGPVEGAEAALGLPDPHNLRSYVRAMGRRLALLLAFLAAGTLALTTWPQQVDEVALRLSDRPFWYGMTGAVLTVGLGLGAGLMALTVIGLPLAVLFLMVLGLAWLIGLVALCRTVGRRLGPSMGRADVTAWLLGAAVFSLLSLVPVLGIVVALLMGFPAVGAAVVGGLSREQHVRQW